MSLYGFIAVYCVPKAMIARDVAANLEALDVRPNSMGNHDDASIHRLNYRFCRP